MRYYVVKKEGYWEALSAIEIKIYFYDADCIKGPFSNPAIALNYAEYLNKLIDKNKYVINRII